MFGPGVVLDNARLFVYVQDNIPDNESSFTMLLGFELSLIEMEG